MAISQYVRPDFVLEADEVKMDGAAVQEFTTRVFTSPAGEGRRATRAFPAELRQKLGQLERRKLAVDEIIVLGEELAELLLPPTSRELFHRSLDRLLPEQGLRLRLRLAPGLADIPWEYMYIQRAGGEKDHLGFLALDPRISIVRHEAVPLPGALDATPRTRRLVAALASPEGGPYAPLKLDQEQANLQKALQHVPNVSLDVVENATIERLEEQLLPGADIFHFAGHGTFQATGLGSSIGSVVGQGQIVLVNDRNEAVPLPADQLAVNLRGHGVQLVILGACQTGRRDEQNVWSGVVAALMAAGIPAAVAMQYTIWDDSAIAFGHRFYQALAAGLPLDQALSAARLAVFNLCHALRDDPQRRHFWRDWGVPVLYLRAEQDFVLPAIADARQRRVVAAASRSAVQQRLDKVRPENPYKFLSPYHEQDHELFRGRKIETEAVLRRIEDQQVLVIYGQAGGGKTSLLCAGVMADLHDRGTLVARIEDYQQPLEAVYAALVAESDEIPLILPAEWTLPVLLHTVKESTGQPCVLVLDQFERLFEPAVGAEAQQAFAEQLVQAVEELEPHDLRLILVIHQDALGRLGALQRRLPDLMAGAYEVLPLQRQEAREAIEAPVELGYPVVYEPGLVAGHLVPDLDDLTPDIAGVRPAQLQIVCHWLYEEARKHRSAVNAQLYYDQAKGADGIMARYLGEILDQQLADERDLAEHVLKTLASPGVDGWIPVSELARDGESPERVGNVAGRLAKAELLVSNALDGRLEYGFASPSVAEEVRRWAGPEVERRYQAEGELQRSWSAWVAWLARGDPSRPEVLATRGQLRRLAEDGGHLTPAAVQALLLLRSAVARDVSADVALAWLGKDGNPALIRQCEGMHIGESERSSRTTLDKARELLGLHGTALPEGRPFGPVAWSAVDSRNHVARQTAALALTAADPNEALDRLDWALREKPRGWPRRRRRAELYGTLADAEPTLAQAVSKRSEDLPAFDRAWIWWWRVRQRVRRNRERIIALASRAALGAGLGLGLLRALTALLTGGTPGVHFSINFLWGVILGATVTVGMLLAELLLLTDPERASGPSYARSRLASAVLAVALGTVFFGSAHMSIGWLLGQWRTITWPALLAAVDLATGVAVSLALVGQPRAGWRLGAARWLLRLGVVALIFGLAQWSFVLAGHWGDTITIAWSGAEYEADLYLGIKAAAWFQALVQRWPQTFDVIGVLDAIVTGVVLTIGAAAGLLLAEKTFARWRDLVNRAGDG